ncbi:hypothetical protein BHS07_18005 [Myxococcus xanthus]|nr:hypothetical protein BHS07_18005 [Myxococcus xanthus]
MEPRMTKYVPHRPHATQAAFLLLGAVREVLFGGAAGGGKSDALLMAALQYVDVPGYAAVLFRRTYQDLNQPDALIPRSKAWLMGTDAHWDKELHQWSFPAGSVLKFAYLQHADDVYNYQGAAYQFIGFDEATQFTQPMYDYLHGRLRKPESMDVPLRMRGSANPGGIGHEWVKAKFIDVPPSSEVAFVPSKLEDNPSLNKAEYEKSLAAIADPVLRMQLRHGDWNVRPAGKLFRREWFHFVDEVPAGLRWLRYWDLAATEERVGARGKPKNDPDWTAGAKVAVRKLEGGAHELWIRDVRRIRGTPREVESFIRATAEEDGRAVPIWLEEEGGSSGKNTTYNYTARVLFGFTVRGHRKTGSKVEMWGPVSSQAQAGNVHLLRGAWNSWWVEEAVAAPNPGVHDDGLDAVAGGMAVASAPSSTMNVGSY